MRLFDNWWEHLPTIARLLPVVLAVIALAANHQVPLDYYWE
jgi:hypothetical protein